MAAMGVTAAAAVAVAVAVAVAMAVPRICSQDRGQKNVLTVTLLCGVHA